MSVNTSMPAQPIAHGSVVVGDWDGKPIGTYRGLGADWFNAEAVAAEDWLRAEQSAMAAFNRESQFNAAEAQKNRDWQEYMSNTSYQRMVKDLRAAGLNPLLAVSNGGAAVPAGSSASSSGGSSNGSRGKTADTGGLLSSILQLVGTALMFGSGIYTNSMNNAAKIEAAKIMANRSPNTINKTFNYYNKR